jgi:ankyrin repeat protein
VALWVLAFGPRRYRENDRDETNCSLPEHILGAMKKAIPSWVLWGVIGLLLVVNLILVATVGWQYRQNGRLRQELVAALAQASSADPSPEDVRRIIEAARLGQLERLKSILDQQPELLHARMSKSDSTLLHHAAFNGRDAVVQELLIRKADVNAKNHGGLTPLHDCVHRGTIESAVMLLERGADLNVRNNEGQTPLAYALAKNRLDMVELLRRRGAQE